MKTHILKLDIQFCDAVMRGDKSFEIRYDDRNFSEGDHIKFIPVNASFSAQHDICRKEYVITYILSGWGIQEGYVVLAIKEV